MEKKAQKTSVKKPKKKAFSWNGEIKLSDLLTIITVIIAFTALMYQRQDLNSKIEDLQDIVNDLEKEKHKREILGLDLETKVLNKFSYNLDYTVNQLISMQDIYDNEIIDILGENIYLLEINLASNALPLKDRNKHVLLKQINNLKQEIFLHNLIFHSKQKEFSNKYEPKKVNFKDDNKYLKAQIAYVDTLKKYNDYLIKKLSSIVSAPSQKLKEIERKYLNIK